MRLQVRGIDSSIINPIEIQALDTASPADRALGVLASFPFLLIFVIFMGGFYLAIDTTAGERDQGSLEPLLAQPVSRESLVVGKMSATSAFPPSRCACSCWCSPPPYPSYPFTESACR